MGTARTRTYIKGQGRVRVSLLPLAVAQRMEVTVEEGAVSDSETKFNGRKDPLELGLGLALLSPFQL